MKKIAIALALLFTILTTSSGTHAQTPSSKKPPVTLTPDLSKLSIDKLLQLVQTASAEPGSEETTPLQVIAVFLQLQPGQVSELEELLQARHTALVPLAQQVQALVRQLDTLLNSGGNPAQIGAIVIQIHTLQQQIAQAQQGFLSQFLAMLNSDQLQRLQALQIAVQLQPVIPAFRLIFLF